jgi:hypothetical protein
MIYRRQRKQYIFAGFLAVIVVVNVLFFFILNRPAHTEYSRLEDSIKQLRFAAAASKVRLTGLEKMSNQLKAFNDDKRKLQTTHLIHRPLGYSQIVTTLDSMVQRAGLKKTRVTYNTDLVPHAGLNSVAMTVPLEGNYSSVVSFIRELENSDTFFLITAIDLESSDRSQPNVSSVISNNSGGGGSVMLSLGIETYFYQ